MRSTGNLAKICDRFISYLRLHRCSRTVQDKQDTYRSPLYNKATNRGRLVQFLAIRNDKVVIRDNKKGVIAI